MSEIFLQAHAQLEEIPIRIENRIHIAASGEIVYRLAEGVENWPRILPHYRCVEILGVRPEGRIVEMSAYRTGIPIPVRWRAIQRLDQARQHVHYQHIGGVTRGMVVEWRIEPSGGGQDVTIVHDFTPNWPWPGPWIARHLVCGFFVHAIADRTLRYVKAAAESASPSPGEQSL